MKGLWRFVGDGLHLLSGGLANLAMVVEGLGAAVAGRARSGRSPHELLGEVERWNRLESRAARLRRPWMRHPVAPDVALVRCMDARFSGRETMGGLLGWCFDLGTPAGISPPLVLAGLEVAVLVRGVRLVIFSEHSDCAAKRTAADPAWGERAAALADEIARMGKRRQEFVERPAIATRIRAGELVVVAGWHDEETQRLVDLRELRPYS